MPSLRAAASTATSPKNKSACPLTGISDRLHLATFADARNPILMRHFVRHYATSVGVPLAHFLVFVHGNASLPASREMRALLLASGVPESGVRAVEERWSDKLMLSLVNAHIKTLPKDHWFIYPNADEFFSYPCDLSARIARGDRGFGNAQVFCACMEDRVAASGRVTPLRDAPAIESQYPRPCYMRRNLAAHMNTRKVTLFQVAARPTKGRRQYNSPHKLAYMSGKAGRCNPIGAFAHYTMTTQYVGAIEHKLKSFGWPASVLNDYQTQLRFLKEHAEGDGGKSALDHKWCRTKPPLSPFVCDDPRPEHDEALVGISR